MGAVEVAQTDMHDAGFKAAAVIGRQGDGMIGGHGKPRNVGPARGSETAKTVSEGKTSL